MKRPFFSIVITAYNSEKYIKQCIFSVLNQNFGEYELIIIDDCSSDNTLKVIEKINDERIKLIKLSENKGAANARNIAINMCNGQYVFFLDSDDYIENGMLKDVYDELLRTNVDVLFCPYFVFWENKNKYKFSNPQYRLDKIKKLPRPFGKNAAKEKLFEVNYELCTKFYKRDFLLKNAINFKALLFGEDLPFYWEILEKAQSFSYIKGQYYCYRKGHKGINTSTILEYLPLALKYSKTHAKENEKIFYEKSAKMLNFWIIKAGFNKDLYNFAMNFCPDNKILNINSTIARFKYSMSLKLFGKI